MALDFSHGKSGDVLLAVGLENGEILVYRAERLDLSHWSFLKAVLKCADSIARLAWRSGVSRYQHELAIASSDRSLRIIGVQI